MNNIVLSSFRYVAWFSPKSTEALRVFNTIKRSDWVDEKTKALVIEFVSYNTDVEKPLVSYFTMCFEIVYGEYHL